jgi:PAS domain S-box-containing protein
LVAAATLATVQLDSLAPSGLAAAASGAAFSYVGYAVLAVGVLWIWGRSARAIGIGLHVCDLGWAFVLTSLTGGVSSHLSPPLFVFAVMAAAYRWGYRETLLTGVAAIALMVGEATFATAGWIGAPLGIGDFIMRAGWMAIVAAILGYLAEREKRLRAESNLLARIGWQVNVEAGLDPSLCAVMNELSRAFGGSAWLLVMEDAISREIFLWASPDLMARQTTDGQPIVVERSQRAAYLFPVPAEANAWGATRQALRGWRPDPVVRAVDGDGRRASCAFEIPDQLPGSAPWRSLMCLSAVAIESWFGRLLFIDPTVDVRDDEQLRALQTLWKQVGPALANVDLLRRLHAKVVELQAARADTEAAKARLEAVMDSLPTGVAIIDEKGGNIRSNAEFERIWGAGRPPTNSIGDYAAYKAWWIDSGRQVQPEEWASARAVRRGETVVGQAVEIEKFDGGRARVLNSAAPIFDATGQVTGCAVAIHDITQQVEAQKALAMSEAALTQANERLRVANEALHRINATLEARVQARTADLALRTTQLQALARDLTRAEERERQRVAQVIHDHVQQLLSVARINLGMAMGQAGANQIHEALTEVDRVIAETLDITRSLTADLNPAILDRSGLATALRWLGRWYADRFALNVTVEADDDPRLEKEIRVTLFRGVRELLFNVVKHAGVMSARVHLECGHDGQTVIVVSDDGAGFDPDAARRQEGLGTSFGLFGLRERLESLGGYLKVSSAPGRGTSITLYGPAPQTGSTGA